MDSHGPMDLWTYGPMDLWTCSPESPQRLRVIDGVNGDELCSAPLSGLDADRSLRDVEHLGQERDECVVGGAVDRRGGELDEEYSVADPGDGRSASARGDSYGEKGHVRSQGSVARDQQARVALVPDR